MSVDTSQIAKLDVEPGELPPTMAAWVIRAEREGEPTEAFQLEEMEVPEPGAFEVIVRDRDNRMPGPRLRLSVARQHHPRRCDRAQASESAPPAEHLVLAPDDV